MVGGTISQVGDTGSRSLGVKQENKKRSGRGEEQEEKRKKCKVKMQGHREKIIPHLLD